MAEKVAAQDQRNYLVSNTRIMDMMKDMMEHSNKMASETEKIKPLWVNLRNQVVPEPVKNLVSMSVFTVCLIKVFHTSRIHIFTHFGGGSKAVCSLSSLRCLTF